MIFYTKTEVTAERYGGQEPFKLLELPLTHLTMLLGLMLNILSLKLS